MLNQTFEDFEILIIDDGSTDSSVTKLKQIEDDRICLLQQKNQGVSTARNEGIKKANGKFIAFLDADDEWYPNFLANIFEMIKTYPNHLVFATNYEVEIAPNRFRNTQFSFPLSQKKIHIIGDFFEASRKDAILLTIATVIKKKAFEFEGYFNEDLKAGEDTDLFIRLGLEYSIAFHTEIAAKYNLQSENNLSKMPYFEDRLEVLRTYAEVEHETLQQYLHLNLFHIGIRAKLAGNKAFEIAKKEIDFRYLTKKQKRLFNLPAFALRALKQIQKILAKTGVYVSTS